MSTVSPPDVSALLAERQSLITQAGAIDATARAADRDLTAEEVAKIDSHLARARLLAQQITDARAAAEHSAPPAPELIIPTALSGRPALADAPRPILQKGGAKYADLFGEPRSHDGFRSWGEYLGVVNSNRFDTRIRAGMSEGVDSEGGFLVPDVYASQILDQALESEIVRPRAQVWPMTSETLKVPGFDGANHSTSLFGGIIAYWIAEGTTIDESAPTTRMIQLAARKLAVLTASSNELAADAPNFERNLSGKLIKGASWSLDYAFLTGTGAGQPKGVLTDLAMIEVTAEANQTAGTIWYSNLVKMFARLHPSCYASAVWVANPTTIPQLLRLDLHADAGSNSTVGDYAYPAFKESNGTFTLFGREVIFTEKLPTLGTKGDIILADFSQYAIGLRKEITLEKSAHAGFATDKTYFRTITRVDGMGTWASAVTPKNGDSLSWCVCLAARA